MTIKLGINGFGRIGRSTLRALAESGRKDVEIVKLNATGPIESNAHLFRYDTVHGRYKGDVKISGDTIDTVCRGPPRPIAANGQRKALRVTSLAS